LDRARRRIVVIAVAIVAVAIASLLYLAPRGASTAQRSSRQSPSLVATHGPSPLQSPSNFSCPPTRLKFTGIFNECVAAISMVSCVPNPPNPMWVVLATGTQHKFLLYIQIDGAYHGPGTYSLVPWPNATFGASDGVTKIAVREYTTGALWQSSAGSLTVDDQGNGGWIYAGLGASANSPVQVDLNIAGWWTCS